MKFAILFSGQGAQKAGMGLDFYSDPLFAQTVEEASAAAQLDLRKIMKSEHGELSKTANVQPALVTVSAGIYRLLQRDLPKLPVGGMVGLSLGEYAGLIASGAIDFDAGIALLADRGRYMQADADAQPSAMAALVGPDLERVQETLSAYPTVWVANYNSPRQVVIGGPTEELRTAANALKDAGAAKKIVILKVSGAFHTPLFNKAAHRMHERLKDVKFNQPALPVISNTTVEPFQAATIGPIMERQLAVPTHFGADLQYLIECAGIDATLEIGPGRTLTSFAHQVDRSLKRANIASRADYDRFIEEHQQWT
ncbi:ACP S-malonyltransferase [Limosilactobacillus sp.]|jgi:[acyl-carrier-protein] S-malonyltransferase|uniref:ACP S-malonyltransferase n=1 Tax=Limosilactobacillus sp. TaxID=2773925 RepID=UPI0025B868A9|nr:ACP S-malonyltransferase [Limosilactobacillus sp.]MCH3922882.1 ACP S-malonyltransferase [Limosilactobacillus sp.]MCH3927565.1 ACP S-malonyltransferase [Limosilactobacillus sp.]